MSISASHLMHTNHIIGGQGLRTANNNPAIGNQSSDFDHILNGQLSTSNSNPTNGNQGAGFNHILGSQGLRTGSTGPSNGESTTQGTVSSSKNGDGTFSKQVEDVNGHKVVDMTVTYANGKTRDIEKTVTVNADGSKTITKTNANGKTSTIEESHARDANGNVVISKESTNAKGRTTEATVTVSKSVTGEVDHSISRTNAKGETETLDRVSSSSDGVRAVTTTGTGYDGTAINNETTWTTVA